MAPERNSETIKDMDRARQDEAWEPRPENAEYNLRDVMVKLDYLDRRISLLIARSK